MEPATLDAIRAGLRRLRTAATVWRARRFLTHAGGLHVGRNATLWAPDAIRIGRDVYIGKDVTIECNCEIGDYALVANRVAFVGRHDHDFGAVGTPMRYTPWIGSARRRSPWRDERAIVEADAWIGYGAIVLTGTRVGRGAVVAAGSVVTQDVAPYAIVAGVPARVVGSRFADAATIARHERGIAGGTFAFSERGFDHCTVRPALSGADAGPSEEH